MRYVIASRSSRLALYQANYVQQQLQMLYPQQEWVIETFTTTGDRFQDKPLSEFGGKGAFLKEIEEAILEGRAQLAVHSLKDVPAVETPGLQLCSFPPREDPRDAWISKQEEFRHLPSGKIVGTSSLRRKLLIQFYRSDLRVENLRGNLDTRIKKLLEGQYDAIVLAAAGLNRLQLFQESYMHYLSEDAFIPAIGQGLMVIQIHHENKELREMVRSLNDPLSETASRIERAFLSYFKGGCYLPIGALATWKSDKWHFRAFIGGTQSGRIIQDSIAESDPAVCAPVLFEKLKRQGATQLLAELEGTP